MPVEQLFEQGVIPAAVRRPPAHHLHTQRFALSGRAVNLRWRFATCRARHPSRPRRASPALFRHPQQALPGQMLDQPPAFRVLQPPAGPLPLQQFTGRARNLRNAQAGKIRGDLTNQLQIGGGEITAGKAQWPQGCFAHRL